MRRTQPSRPLILQGTLRLMQVQSLSANTHLTLAEGATLALDFNGEMKVAKLTIAGLDQSAGTFSTSRMPKSIKGTGTLKVER